MPAAPSNYVDKETLARLVSEHQKTRHVSEELADVLMKIAGGVWDRWRYGSDRDEFVQDCTLHLMQRPIAKVDVTRNVFAYLTQCARRHGWKMGNKAEGEKRRFEAYANECVENGRALPKCDEEEEDGEEEADWLLLEDWHGTAR